MPQFKLLHGKFSKPPNHLSFPTGAVKLRVAKNNNNFRNLPAHMRLLFLHHPTQGNSTLNRQRLSQQDIGMSKPSKRTCCLPLEGATENNAHFPSASQGYLCNISGKLFCSTAWLKLFILDGVLFPSLGHNLLSVCSIFPGAQAYMMHSAMPSAASRPHSPHRTVAGVSTCSARPRERNAARKAALVGS